MSLIQGVWDGKTPIPEGDEVVDNLAGQLAGSSIDSKDKDAVADKGQ